MKSVRRKIVGSMIKDAEGKPLGASFGTFSGTIRFGGRVEAGDSLSLEIDMTSVSPAKLKSDAYFAVAKHSKATFDMSRRPGETGWSGTWKVRGKKKFMGFPATLKPTAAGVHMKAEITLEGMKKGLYSDSILLELDINAKR